MAKQTGLALAARFGYRPRARWPLAIVLVLAAGLNLWAASGTALSERVWRGDSNYYRWWRPALAALPFGCALLLDIAGLVLLRKHPA